MHKTPILVLTLIALLACCHNQQPDSTTKNSIDDETKQNKEGDKWNNRFKYGHIAKWTPEIFKKDTLKLIDSLFHYEIIQQIEGYSFPYSDCNNYFISRQHDMNGLTALTVSLYWDLCHNGVSLLLLDRNDKLLNCIELTEWYSSCDLVSNTETEFLNDSTFKMHCKTTEIGETNSVHDFEYIGKINSAGRIDTLKINVNRNYKE